jgi:hypothetical protein
MAWEDRDYYRGGGRSDYLSNPGLFLTLSTSFGTWFGVPVRLSFWLLVMMLLFYVDSLHGVSAGLVAICGMIFILHLILHDMGHRFFTQRVGGILDRFLLWPYGGLEFPNVAPDTQRELLAYGGGIIAHLIVGSVALVALIPFHQLSVLKELHLNPAHVVGFAPPLEAIWTLPGILRETVRISGMLILANLLPFSWFDGGYLLNAALRPHAGIHRAARIVGIAGMAVAVYGFLFSVYEQSFIGMVFWAFLFADAFNRFRGSSFGATRREALEYPQAFENPDLARKRKPRWPDKIAVKKAAAARRDQEQIDEILAKVHAQGMQSLNWMEKRALRKATERQRDR